MAVYLVSEYANKGDVFGELDRRGGSMSEGDACRLVLQPFLSALHHLHRCAASRCVRAHPPFPRCEAHFAWLKINLRCCARSLCSSGERASPTQLPSVPCGGCGCRLNIIHRDIKPENLLFTTNNVLKVTDFGLSIDVNQERPVTRVGTLDYMAPEVVVCPDKVLPGDHKEKTHLHYTCLVSMCVCACARNCSFGRSFALLRAGELIRL